MVGPQSQTHDRSSRTGTVIARLPDSLGRVPNADLDGPWFKVEGAESSEFVLALRRRAESWPASPAIQPSNTGGWLRSRFVITYADRIDPTQRSVIESFRVDFDGTIVLAARVASERVDQGGLFERNRPEGDEPVKLAQGGADACTRAAAEWFFRQLFES